MWRSTFLLVSTASAWSCATRAVPEFYPPDSAASPRAPAAQVVLPSTLQADDAVAESTGAVADDAPSFHAGHGASVNAEQVAVPASPAPARLSPTTASEPVKATVYACPMHPEIRAPKPGKCTVCGMNLEPVK